MTYIARGSPAIPVIATLTPASNGPAIGKQLPELGIFLTKVPSTTSFFQNVRVRESKSTTTVITSRQPNPEGGGGGGDCGVTASVFASGNEDNLSDVFEPPLECPPFIFGIKEEEYKL